MKALEQNYKKGTLRLVEVPEPRVSKGKVVVRTASSLVSTGTEKHMVDLARKSLLGKALARPDLVKQLVAKARTEGILEAWRQAMGRLETPIPLGYSSAGVVVDVGPGVTGLVSGDRVVCSGSGYAAHAEVASVPANLCVKVPDSVELESAAFAAVGGIALESVRMAQVSLGDTVAVIGLGLVGQIACQLLRSAGCHVIGMDVDASKTRTATEHGAEAAASGYDELARICHERSAGHGVDAVVIMAATDSDEPIEQAALICRERGRVVATGLVGLQVPRKPFYDKELELVVSRAWGPGTDDANYTEKGLDYPIAYARWTARRNLEEFMRLLATGSVQVEGLITHRFPLVKADEAYDLILEGKEPAVAVLLSYPDLDEKQERRQVVRLEKSASATGQSARRGLDIGIGVIGAGQFANGTLLPAIKSLGDLRFQGIAAATGLSARNGAERHGFEYCATDYREVLGDASVDLVFVLTRHDSHAHLAAEALEAGKHVFVEKPLALNIDQLNDVQDAVDRTSVESGPSPMLMVGFNRRFSPLAGWLKDRFAGLDEPLAVHCTVNAGLVGSDSWLHDPEQGGGRIVGEVCHYVDLIQYFTGSLPASVHAESLDSDSYRPSDNVAVTLKMSNGALGSIVYLSGGDKRYPRERIEVFGGSAVGVIDNFKSATFTHQGRTRRKKRWSGVDRGHRGEVEALLAAIRGAGPAPVDFGDYAHTTLATFAIEESLARRRPVDVGMSEQAT